MHKAAALAATCHLKQYARKTVDVTCGSNQTMCGRKQGRTRVRGRPSRRAGDGGGGGGGGGEGGGGGSGVLSKANRNERLATLNAPFVGTRINMTVTITRILLPMTSPGRTASR